MVRPGWPRRQATAARVGDVRRAQSLGYAVPPSLIEKLERATGRPPR